MRSSNPIHDASRHQDREDAIEAAIAKLCEETEISDNDYVAALQPEYYDPSDLVTAVFNSANAIGTNAWVLGVLKQTQIDDELIRDAAEELKNDRVAREYDPTGE